MLQKSYSFKTTKEFRQIAQQIRNNSAFSTSRSCLLQLAIYQSDTDFISEVLDIVYKDIPGACVAGITNDNTIRKDHAKLISSCNVVYFTDSEVSITSYNFEVISEEEAGSLLDSRIKALSYVQGILLFASGIDCDVNKFIDSASGNMSNIPIFGSCAGLPSQENENGLQERKTPLVFEGDIYAENILSKGVVVVILHGKDLHVRIIPDIGWQPLGKELEITGTAGSLCATTIDDMPATYIYDIYLHVTPDKNFLMNICDFPLLLTERYGIMQNRVPINFDNDGKLYFGANIHKGERIRLTYGNIRHMLTEAQQNSNLLYRFGSQALFIYASSIRDIFLKQAAQKELGYYRNVNNELFCCYGWGEILKFQTGGVLNASLISVAMHEGHVVHPTTDINPPENLEPARLTMPLSSRLISFLETTNKEMKESSEAKSNFLSNMSHEIRTPINAVLGMDEMILRECKDDNIRGYALDIQRAGKMLLSLINDILDFSKIEANKLEILPSEYDLSSTITDLVNMASPSAKRKGLNLIVQVDKNTPHKLYGDESRLKQCMLNIITNAIKYTKEGSVTISIEGKQKDAENLMLTIKVVDTGIGIKKADMKRLFTPFERIEESKNRNIEGTGLGMSIVRGLLSKMNSNLEVKSEYGHGSTFAFTIEQKVISWEPIGDYKQTQSEISKDLPSYRESFQAPDAHILVVDDMNANLTVIKGLLKATRIKIDTASNAQDALKLAHDTKYDILIIDHLMPNMDGIQMLHELRKDKTSANNDTICIALTANAIMGAKEMYIKEGFESYLPKPVDGTVLEETLVNFLPRELILLPGDKGFIEEKKTANVAPTVQADSELYTAFSDLFGINIQEGLKNCGTWEVLKETASSFLESLPHRIELTEEFKNAKNLKEYTVQVHGIKGAARLIGAQKLSEPAAYLEQCGDSGNIKEIEAKTEDFIKLCKEYIIKLQPLSALPYTKSQVEEKDTRPLIQQSQMEEALYAIKEYISAFDISGAESVTEAIEQYRVPDDFIKTYKEIKELLKAGDRANILLLLKNLKGASKNFSF